MHEVSKLFLVFALHRSGSSAVAGVAGLKDPGMVITFDFLKPYFEMLNDITYVFVWCPLNECIQSLAHRHNADFAAAQTVLEPYFANLNYHREQLEKGNKDIVDIYFADLLENPEDFVKNIYLRLNYNSNYIDFDVIKEFLNQDLKHV
ncbi:hypothetical protein [Paenibacillus medicaginis]|uniref:Sulfotransferase family protein n=1 Tax=Paenibacillus medicaginis TaxID=1470560 RepID=A0ABV5C6R0_9BACL